MTINNKHTLVPLDSRPVSDKLPAALARLCGWSMSVPPHKILGGLHEQADIKGIETWLNKTGLKNSAGLFIAFDLILYGGLVFSRDSKTTTEQAIANAQLLRRIKKTYPGLNIYAFGVILRDSITVRSKADFALWKKLSSGKSGYPAWFLDIRARNHALNKLLIDMAAEGTIAHAVLGKEDTAPGNPFAHEVTALKKHAQKLGATSKVTIINGTDELPLLMIARKFARDSSYSPSFHIGSANKDFLKSTPVFESRPLNETLRQQINFVGATISNKKQSGITLLIHPPRSEQQDMFALQLKAAKISRKSAFNPTNAQSKRDIGRIISEISNATTQIAVADLAFANGSDPALVDRLLNEGLFFKPIAYAGWNTSSNTLGTVVATATVAHIAAKLSGGKSKRTALAHLNLMAGFLLDDYLYQSIVRTALAARSGQPHFLENPAKSNKFLNSEIETEFIRIRTQIINRHLLANGLMDNVQITISDFGHSPAVLPWNRIFEADVHPLINIKLKYADKR